MARVPYNKLLTSLAGSSCTREYWPSVVFVRTSLRLVCTAMTSSQYSPVWPLRSVSNRLIFVLGRYLFLKAHNFPRATVSENCSFIGTGHVPGQICEHIFAPKGGYCLFISMSEEIKRHNIMPCTITAHQCNIIFTYS